MPPHCSLPFSQVSVFLPLRTRCRRHAFHGMVLIWKVVPRFSLNNASLAEADEATVSMLPALRFDLGEAVAEILEIFKVTNLGASILLVSFLTLWPVSLMAFKTTDANLMLTRWTVAATIPDTVSRIKMLLVEVTQAASGEECGQNRKFPRIKPRTKQTLHATTLVITLCSHSNRVPPHSFLWLCMENWHFWGLCVCVRVRM